MNNQRLVCLTIDDGPSRFFIEKIDYLYSNDIPAIFFCRGDLMERDSTSISYAIKKGFIICNHSYDHPYFSEISLNEAYEQIVKTDRIIDKIYKDSKVIRPIKFFRFPFGDRGNKSTFVNFLDTCRFRKMPRLVNIGKKIFVNIKRKPNHEIQNYLRVLGYRKFEFNGSESKYFEDNGEEFDILWTYDIGDWRRENSRTVIKRLEKDLPTIYQRSSNPMNILLMHDQEEIRSSFFDIIDYLKKERFNFKLPFFPISSNKKFYITGLSNKKDIHHDSNALYLSKSGSSEKKHF